MGTEKIADLQATAAYNFVPLGPEIVPAEFVHVQEEAGHPAWPALEKEQQQACFSKHVRETGKNSGWLELDITALTPLLVGGASDNGQFFAPLDPDHPALPGSSLRGLVRSLVKILACGAMRPNDDFEDKNLYFRVVAGYGNDALKTHYDQLTEAEQGGSSAGFLVKRQDGSFYISPCQVERLSSQSATRQDRPRIQWKKVKKKNGEEESIATTTNGPMMDRKKHIIQQARYQFFHGRFSTKYPVPSKLIYNYDNDPLHADENWASKNKAIDLLDPKWSSEDPDKMTKDPQAVAVVPCHFVLESDGETVRSFGHGPKYRIPYANAIQKSVPKPLRQLPEACADLADAIFGVGGLWSGRGSFEDARLTSAASYEAPSLPRPQMVPRPTAYQMYLEQGRSSGAATKHWDSKDATMRGYKFYWHSNAPWKKQSEDPPIKNTKEIQPLQKGAKFHSRVWFQDLSDVELGALCAAFDLGADDHTAYKLGRGKAIGMGSIRIRATLHLQDEDAKYHSFLGTTGQLCHVLKDGALKTYVQAFEAYRTKNLGSLAEDFQKTLLALQDILDFTPVTQEKAARDAWNQQIATMSVTKDPDKRFARHVVLPDIRTVVRQAKEKQQPSEESS